MTPSVELHLPGPECMARDVALLQRAEEGEFGLRIYTWDGPWVSLGRFQRAERALLHPAETKWVLRPTGGKAVLHGHDITIGLAAPLAAIGVDSRSVGAAYRVIIRPIVAALQALGAPAALGEDTRFVASAGATADCFAHVAPNDVVHRETGQKVCGCALKLTDRAVLVQASIPAGPPLLDPGEVFAAPHAAAWLNGLEPAAFAEALAQTLGELEAKVGR